MHKIVMTAALILCVVLLLSQLPAIRSSDQCGQDLTGDSGQLVSPGFPMTYPLDVTCNWTISAQAGKAINLHFITFSTDTKQNNNGGDVLRIFTSNPTLNRTVPAQWEFSGILEDGLVIYTNSNKLWIHFQADNQQLSENSNFNITFHSISLQICTEPEKPKNGSRIGDSFIVGSVVHFSCDEGFTISGHANISCQINNNGSTYWSGDIPECSIPCVNGKITESVEGQSNLLKYFLVPNDKPVILSPKQQQRLEYLNNSLVQLPVRCTWAIHAPANYAINITASQFNLHAENGSFLTVEKEQNDSSSDSIFGNFSSSFTNIFINQTNQVLIQLESNNVNDAFELRYILIPYDMCDAPPVPTNMFNIPGNLTFPVGNQIEYRCRDGFYLQEPNNLHIINTCTSLGWLYGDGELPQCLAVCQIWDMTYNAYKDIILRHVNGVIYSPGFPGPLLPGPCQITIEVHRSQIVRMTLSNMTLEKESDVKVTLFDGSTVLAVISGASPLGTITSTTNTVIVKIDNKQTHAVDGHFILHYEAVLTNTCGKPKAIQNGRLLDDETQYEVGSTVQFVCDAFFQRHGPRSITCINMGAFNDWQGSPSCIGKCGGQYTMEEGIIVSPNYPMSFNTSGVRCVWLITVPGEHKRFNITIPEIHISSMDDLSITENQQTTSIQTICTEDCSQMQLYTHTNAFQVSFLPTPVTINNSSRFRVKFVAFDSSFCSSPPGVENGFFTGLDYSVGSQIRYHCGPPYDLIGSSLLTCRGVHHGPPQWQPHVPECRICRLQSDQLEPILRRGGEGAVASPGYPNNQTLGHQSCIWRIEAKEDELLELHFRYMQLPNAEEGLVFVDIYDGQSKLESRLVRLDGKTERLGNITSTTNIIIIQYSMPLETKDTRGFYVEYGSKPKPEQTTAYVPEKTEEKWTERVTSVFQPKETTKLVTERRRTSPIWVMSTEKATLFTPPPDQRNTKTTVFFPTKFAPTTTLTTAKIGNVRAVASDRENKGAIAAGVLVPLLIITAVGVIGFLIWYRKKYPVRMNFGREFAKFTNPAYDRKPSAGLTLVQEGHVSLCSDPDARRPSDEGGSSNEGPGKGIINPAFEDLDDCEVPTLPEVTYTDVTTFSEEESPVRPKRLHSSIHSDASSARRKSAKLKITPEDYDNDESVHHSPPWETSSTCSDVFSESLGRRSSSWRESIDLPSRSGSLVEDGGRKTSFGSKTSGKGKTNSVGSEELSSSPSKLSHASRGSDFANSADETIGCESHLDSEGKEKTSVEALSGSPGKFSITSRESYLPQESSLAGSEGMPGAESPLLIERGDIGKGGGPNTINDNEYMPLMQEDEGLTVENVPEIPVQKAEIEDQKISFESPCNSFEPASPLSTSPKSYDSSEHEDIIAETKAETPPEGVFLAQPLPADKDVEQDHLSSSSSSSEDEYLEEGYPKSPIKEQSLPAACSLESPQADIKGPLMESPSIPVDRDDSLIDEQSFLGDSMSAFHDEAVSPSHRTPTMPDDQLSAESSPSQSDVDEGLSSDDGRSSQVSTAPPMADEHFPSQRDLALNEIEPTSPVHSYSPSRKMSSSSSSTHASDSMEFHSVLTDPSSPEVFQTPETGLSNPDDSRLNLEDNVAGYPVPTGGEGECDSQSQAERTIPKQKAKLLIKVDPDEMDVSSDESGEISNSDSSTSRELDLDFLGWTKPDSEDLDSSEV